jgi:hypothetical protein
MKIFTPGPELTPKLLFNLKTQKMKKFKILLCLLSLPLFLVSCEPEEVPVDNSIKSDPVNLFLDTGNQDNPPETRN